MKFSRLGIIAAMAMALCGQQALAADAPPAFKMDPKVHAQSMKDAPAIIQQANVPCEMTDAYLVGSADEKVGGKPSKASATEVACGSGMGYFIITHTIGDPAPFNCLALKQEADKAIAAKKKPQNSCQLPGNAKPEQGLLPLIVKSGVTDCGAITKANYNGSSAADKIDVYEALCASGSDYYIESPVPGSSKQLAVIDCAKGVDCALISKDDAAKSIIRLSAAAKKPECAPTKARYVGGTSTSEYYEIGCADGKSGYMFETTKANQFKTVIECVKATQLGGGCNFTNVSTGNTADIPTYQKLAAAIKDPCTITKYQSYGADESKREIVELACTDPGAAGFALLPADKGQTGEYFNCIRAEIKGYTCHLTDKAATYATLSKQIAGRGKVTCAVDNARPIGRDNAKGNDYVEVTCGAQPSLVLTYSRLPEETLTSAVVCAQAEVANACTLKK
jgi:hypothetical protein